MFSLFRCLASCFLVFFLTSCGLDPLESYRRKGAREADRFATALEAIHNIQELASAEATIQRHFLSLVDLMIAARKWQTKHGAPLPPLEPYVAYAKLEKQLVRIASMEGGSEVLQRAQQEALIRLDRYEHRIQKHESAFSY